MSRLIIRTRLCLGVFITLIAFQPIILIMGLYSVPIGFSPRAIRSLAQEPGSRLLPSEYTDHVPIIIDGTGDFGAQGYPGSGTSGDPYVISGLNITADADMDCITIINTTAYFVIRDCYLNQLSSPMGPDPLSGIRLLNTTHGTIEYCTVISAERGIWLINANNTLVTHTASNGDSDMALYGENLYYTTYSWNRFESAEHRAMRIDVGDYCTVTNSEFYNYDFGLYCTAFWDLNHTVIDNCEIYSDGGLSGIAVNRDQYTSVSNSYIWAPNADHGVNVDECPNITLTNLTITGPWAGADIDDSPGLVFTDSSISNTIYNGLEMDDSDNSSISNVNIYESGGYGIYLVNTDRTNFSDCIVDGADEDGLFAVTGSDLRLTTVAVSNTAEDGIFLSGCSRPVITECTIGPSIDGSGIYADLSPNGTIIDSSILDTASHGIYTQNAQNWTVTGNTLSFIGEIGIYHSGGAYMEVSGNTISITGDLGVFVDVCPDSMVSLNTISETNSEFALYVSQSERSEISNNDISNCYGGIMCDTSENATIIHNTVSDVEEDGIQISDFDGPYVANNVITNARIGIYTYLHYDLVLESNTMTDCGILFGGNHPLVYYEYNLTGNTVNSLPVYFGLHQDTASIDGSSYGQILLANCSNFDISGGIFDTITCPVELLHCDYVDIDSLTSINNVYAVYVYNSDNVTLSNIDSLGRGYSDTSYAVFAANSDDMIIEDSTFTKSYASGRGVLDFRLCVDVDILNCDVSYGYNGMYLDDTANVTILECDVMHNSYAGIYPRDSLSMYIHIERNYIYNSSYGIYGYFASEWFIKNNTIRHGGQFGIYITFTGIGNITLNTIESYFYGIRISNAPSFYIYNNTIRWNTGYGIDLLGSGGTEVFYNIIAFSGIANGNDNRGVPFYWDDGSVLGNWWDDWDGAGNYEVDSNTFDRYPRLYLPTEPIIDQPMDLSYAEFSTGNTITWQPFDDSLRDWELVIDGVSFAADIWNFVDVTVNVDGLAYGTHTAVLTVWDVSQNSVSDTVLIHVFDDTPPTISTESDQIAFEGATGQTVVWTAYDLHPDTYSYIVDGVVVDSGSWSSGPVVGSLDGLSAGDHTIRMVVRDVDGNSAYDFINVRVVVDNTPPSIDTPADISYTEGFTMNFIIWSPTDEYPDSYVVMYNGTTYESGDWTGAIIAVNVDGLRAGNHTFRITVYDCAGLSVSDSVIVIVTPAEAETTAPPDATPASPTSGVTWLGCTMCTPIPPNMGWWMMPSTIPGAP